jgi:malate-CoA ligase subunit alpha
MSVLLDRDTKVIVQGITGRIGGFHAKEMRDYGTNVVGGVTPGKGGALLDGVPVFNTVKEAVERTGATASIVFVPPPFAADSIMEAADAGLRLCVAITDGIPSQDMIQVKRYMRRYRAENRMTLVGPNCAGIITPGKALLGIMPGHIYQPGNIGIVGRSGTLGYEAAAQMKELGIGVSTSVGIGGDPINGSSRPRNSCATTCRSRSSPISPASPRPRAARWAMPAPSSPPSARAPTRRSRSCAKSASPSRRPPPRSATPWRKS